MMIIEYYDKYDILQEIDTKDYVELLNKSIEHYERMIEWIKTKDQDSRVCSLTMYKELGETWQSTHCVLCNKFGSCYGCPINKYSTCHKGCNYTPWSTLIVEHTWGSWLIAANKEVEFLIYLRDYYAKVV